LSSTINDEVVEDNGETLTALTIEANVVILRWDNYRSCYYAVL